MGWILIFFILNYIVQFQNLAEGFDVKRQEADEREIDNRVEKCEGLENEAELSVCGKIICRQQLLGRGRRYEI